MTETRQVPTGVQIPDEENPAKAKGQPGDWRDDVVERIVRDGFAVQLLTSTEALLAALQAHPKAVVVVCDKEYGRTSREVLAALAAGLRSSPVVVLVERSEFGDYYDVMARGACCYYEQTESPRLIAQAVEWAANNRAA